MGPVGNHFDNPIDVGFLESPENTASLSNNSFALVRPSLTTFYTDTKNNSPLNRYDNDFGQPSDDIYYRFSIVTGTTVTISLFNSELSDTYLHLLNASGGVITYNDDYNGSLKSKIISYLSPGTYYIVVEGYGNSCGNITLDLTVPQVTDPLLVARPTGNSEYNSVPQTETKADQQAVVLSAQIQDEPLIPKFEVYPNPVNDVFTVQFSVTEQTQGTITLYDINGRNIKVLKEGTLYNESFEVPASNLPVGIYTLVVQTAKERMTKKIIKR